MNRGIGEVITQSLIDLGVEVVFGVPGTHIYQVYRFLEDSDIKIIVNRHEQNSVFMSDAYGRVTGRPGVAVVTAGPGFTNTLTAIAQAYTASSPVLVISGDVPVGSIDDFHGVSKPNILSDASRYFTKASVTLMDGGLVEEYVKRGYMLAGSGRRAPVHIAIPRNVMGVKTEYKGLKVSRRAYDGDVEKVVGRLVGELVLGRVLVIFGPEAGYIDYRDVFRGFVDSIDAPFISDTSVIGVIEQGHRLFAGFYEKGFSYHPSTRVLLGEADTLILIGVRPGSVDSRHLLARATNSRRIIYVLPSIKYSYGIDEDDEGLSVEAWGLDGRRYLKITGDYRVVLESLIKFTPSSRGFNTDFKELIWDRYRGIVDEVLGRYNERPMDQGLAIYLISEALPKNSNIFLDVGGNEAWARDLIAPVKDVRYIYAGPYGTLGYSFGAAAGGWIGDPGREAVSITGDGSILMSIMELATISQYNIPVKVLVINDSSYGILSYLSRRDLDREIETYIGEVDYAKIASGMGIEGVRVSEPGELEDTLRDVFRSRKPILVDIVTGKRHVPPLIRDILHSNRA